MDKHLCMIPEAVEGSLYSMSPLFRTYGGDLMNRFDMERWLNEYVTLQTALKNMKTSLPGYSGKRQDLLREMQRKTLEFPVMTKPTGLSALSGKKRREYEDWVSAEPQREAQKRRFEQEEDRRIEGLRTKLAELEESEKQAGTLMRQVQDRIDELTSMQVVAPEYLVSPAPEMMSHYLHTGRAADMSQALNLYHTEQYRAQSLALQKGQLEQIRTMVTQQQMMMWQQEEEHRERMESIAQTSASISGELAGIRRSAENIAFYEALRFWLK